MRRGVWQGLGGGGPKPAEGGGRPGAGTPAGGRVMEAATSDRVAGGCSLGALTTREHEQLFTLLRKVRLAAGDFLG